MSSLRRSSAPAASRRLALATVAIVLIAGCAGEPGGSDSTDTSQPGATSTSAPGSTASTTPGSTTTVSGAPPTLPDIPLVPRSDLPADFPQIPVPAGGEPGGPVSFDGETVGYEYPVGTLADLVAFYEAWFATVGVDPGPTFGSSPARYWDVTFDGMRVKFEMYTTSAGDVDRLAIIYYP